MDLHSKDLGISVINRAITAHLFKRISATSPSGYLSQMKVLERGSGAGQALLFLSISCDITFARRDDIVEGSGRTVGAWCVHQLIVFHSDHATRMDLMVWSGV